MSDVITKEQIENIANFMTGMKILKSKDLCFEGINDVDDVKEILRLKYYPVAYDDTTNVRKSILFQNFALLKKTLREQLTKVKEIIQNPQFKKEFGLIYKIKEERIMDKQSKLEELIKRQSFPILTAGEAKAGKSTLINVLLGTDIMPMGLVTTTRMICEVRNSPNRRATFVLDESDPTKNKVFDLKEDASADILEIVRKDDGTNFLKGCFEYPVDFLDDFTYLVDSPGIGDTVPLEKITFDFLNENAPAFIFVLNATNSNGLNIKAKELISKAREELTKDYTCFITEDINVKNSKCSTNELDKAIFILNHWDIVRANAKSQEEVEEVRCSIVKEIQTLWHESATEGVQIFFLSAFQARQWMKHGLVPTDLIKLRQSLRNLVVKLYERNFVNCLDLLNDILEYIERKILQKINNNVDNKYNQLYKKGHAEKLCSILENIIITTDKRTRKITEDLKPKFVAMAQSLTQHFKSAAVENRILEISKSKISAEKNFEFLTIVLKKLLENQLYEELKIWENETNQMEQLYSYLNGLFESHLVEISGEINIDNMLINLDTLVSAWHSTNSKEIRKFDNAFITKIEQVFIITTITLLFPVVALAGLLATPLIFNYMMKEKQANAEHQKQYMKDPDAYLREIIKSSFTKLSENDVRRCFFKNLSDKCNDHIAAFDEFIKSELGEKRQFIKDIETENREMPDILWSLNILLGKTQKCYGDYHILRNNYHPDETLTKRITFYLKGNETELPMSEIISLGKTSTVFRSQKYGNTLFKTYEHEFVQQYARFQMQEIEILSMSPNQYILHLKHFCYLKQENKLLLVLENVDCNLHAYMNNHHDLIPMLHKRDSDSWLRAFRFVIDVCKQLCMSLRYLHTSDRRMVHPDLRIETILVSKSNSVDRINIFICDACANLLTQKSHKMSGNVPDLPLEYCFDMGGYTKENIYRLGIILYKLAYFEVENIKKSTSGSNLEIVLSEKDDEFVSIESLESDISIDWSEDKHLEIPEKYNDLIMECLSKHPQNRPDVDKCLEKLNNLDFE